MLFLWVWSAHVQPGGKPTICAVLKNRRFPFSSSLLSGTSPILSSSKGPCSPAALAIMTCFSQFLSLLLSSRFRWLELPLGWSCETKTEKKMRIHPEFYGTQRSLFSSSFSQRDWFSLRILHIYVATMALQFRDWGWPQKRVRIGKNKNQTKPNTTRIPFTLSSSEELLFLVLWPEWGHLSWTFCYSCPLQSSVTQAMLSSKLGNKGGKNPRKFTASTNHSSNFDFPS